jgi:hypothetical protein
MRDSAIDRAIDEVAAEMAAGQPSASFRGEVMKRLDQPREVRWWWMVSPVAAVALLVCAVLFGPDAVRSPKTPADMARRVPLTGRATSLEGMTVAGHDPLPIIRQPSRQSAGPQQFDSAVAALAPPPLDIPLLTVDALGPAESIHVSSLESIAPITLAPIGAPQGEPR